MSDYGMHPTRYCGLSNGELYSMYRESVYSSLNDSEKLDLLQETVNRDALERGEIGSPLVQFSSLSANVSGNAANGTIQINYDVAVKGMQSVEYNGQIIERQMDDYNIQALNTVLHENIHCWQDQVNDGTIMITDNHLASEYQANSFTTSAVLQNGSYRLGSQYLTGETPGGYYMYALQATERDAFLQSEQKTDSILQGLSEKYGTEKSFESYVKGVEANGYHAMEQRAVQLFANPNFEHDLNQVLQNQYFGTNVPVNPNTEAAVKTEMVASYQLLQPQMAQYNSVSKEESHMGFNPQPVSLEEYNQSLRDSVNSYFQHAMNDPTVSQEEAIRTTGEMAEQYLDAVGEFQAAQGVQAENDMEDISTANDVEAEVGSFADSGPDTGDSLDGGNGLDAGDGLDI